MFDHIGLDTEYNTIYFDAVEDTRFAGIPPTTWRELVDARRIKQLPGTTDYWLTGSGWYEGMRLAGRADSDDVRQRCVAVMQALKQFTVRTSHTDTLVDIEEIARVSGTSKAWCHNAIESGLLRLQFPGQQINARVESFQVVFIPPNFGHAKIRLYGGDSTSAL